MKKLYRTLLIVAAAAMSAISCSQNNEVEVSSKDAYFFTETLAYNLTSNPVINIPVVRLGSNGDVSVNVSATGSSEFSVPTNVTIKDGDRLANLEVAFDITKLTKNQIYNLEITISDFASKFGYKKASVIIEYPTSYYEYGAGHISEDWWAEEEDKSLYVRDYAENVLQCYLPDCWGHDSGPSYDVQDYVFYWNTATNKVYVPFQYMGYMYIGDLGAIACKFGGPDHAEGSAAWMSFIDTYYATNGGTQPHFDPETKTFFLADAGATDANGVYEGGKPDVLVLE